MLQIHKDGLSIASYVARTLDGVAQNSHLRSDNYFYYNCLMGRCVTNCIPPTPYHSRFNALLAQRCALPSARLCPLYHYARPRTQPVAL